MLHYGAGADINLQDHQGMTPIHEAGYRGQSTVYNELIRLCLHDDDEDNDSDDDEDDHVGGMYDVNYGDMMMIVMMM